MMIRLRYIWFDNSYYQLPQQLSQAAAWYTLYLLYLMQFSMYNPEKKKEIPSLFRQRLHADNRKD